MMERNALIALLRGRVTMARFEHCLGVEAMAVKLAPRFGIVPEQASQAALLHDLCRDYPGDFLLKLAVKFDIVIDDIEQEEPVLLHGPVGAVMARDLGIEELDILEAIASHTTGGPNLSALSQLIFVADLIEPGRTFPWVDQLRKDAVELPVSQLLVEVYNHTIEFLIRQGYAIHPRTVAGRNQYIKKGVVTI